MKHADKTDADHLLAALGQMCECKTDWAASRCFGLTLEWDCARRRCTISMPRHVLRALQRFLHARPKRPEHSPHAWQKPTHGAKTQHAPPSDESEPLDAADTKFVQEALGTFCWES